MLDSSTSVGPDNFALMLNYVKELVAELTAGGLEHRFSLITYSTEVKTIFSFTRYHQAQQVLEAVATTRSVCSGLWDSGNILFRDIADFREKNILTNKTKQNKNKK